ncbi:MAG TPA: hypothetical protein VHK01_06100 [Lacipirellulaceae bacterium]|jgi:hypothetical protein|nr:hypothetical protein [Lacipirellulaceae bacterium]
MNSELTDGSLADFAANKFEFRDTRMFAKYLMGAIAGLGLFGAVSLFRQANNHGSPIFLIAAGAALVAMLVGLAIVYFAFGQPVLLRQTATGIERVAGTKQQRISFGDLYAFRAKWTDVLRNGVYSYTQVRLGFSSQDPAAPVITYDATADFETLKYEQLQEFQDVMAGIVAERMLEAMQRDGRVEWTSKLALRSDGLEITKKPGAAPELVGFDRVSQWKIDQGLFKLGVDDSKRPVLTENVSEWNFYPGLSLFLRLCDSPGSQSAINAESYVNVS